MFDLNGTSSSRAHHIALCLKLAVRAMPSAAIAVLAVATLILFVGPRTSQAQVLYGSLTGNVTDPNGAPVAGAKVEVTNASTGNVRTATTDDRGGYSFSDLQVGVYKITVSMASFKTLLQEDVKVGANVIRRHQRDRFGLEITPAFQFASVQQHLQEAGVVRCR